MIYFLYGSARSEEAGVSLDYLKCIHEKHEKWFIEGAFEKPGNGGAISFVWSSIQMCFDVLCKPFTLSEVICLKCLYGLLYVLYDCC